MDGNLSEMLKDVLADPDAMEKLMGAAEKLMGSSKTPSSSTQEKEQEEEKKEEQAQAAHAPVRHEKKASNEDRIALLCALRPYLSPERRKSADSLIRMLKMMKLADLNKLFGS